LEGDLAPRRLLAGPVDHGGASDPGQTGDPRRRGLPAVSQGPGAAPPSHHYRLIYAREGALRWLAHRELMRAVYRLLHRSGLPLAFTQGYNPKPKVAFGPPLPVGAESHHEELDIYLAEERPLEEILARLRAVFPTDEGLVPLRVVPAFGEKSAHSLRRGARWAVRLDSLGISPETARKAVARWKACERFPLRVERPRKEPRQLDLKQLIARPAVEGGALCFDLSQDSRSASAKPSEVVAALTGIPLEQVRSSGRFLLTEALLRSDAVPCP
ncbi:MAG: DUF2344 domain-containing protein, partial [Planctomycetota bacterium]